MDSLWLDPKLGDGLVDINFHTIPIGKPKNFFRVNPDPAYRRLTEIYTHKIEGQIDEQHYIIAKPMRGQIEEATAVHARDCRVPRRLHTPVAAEAA